MVPSSEIKFHREQRERILDAAFSRPAEDIIGEWALAFGDPDSHIVPSRPGDYAHPEHFGKTLPPEALRELRDLLEMLRGFREQLVGLTIEEASILYNGDDMATFLGQEFSRWGLAQLSWRLAKPSFRDGRDPFATWDRLQREFVSWLGALASARGSGHIVAMSGVRERMTWELWQATWAHFVDYDRHRLIVGDVPDGWEDLAHSLVRMNGWDGAHLGRALMRDTPHLREHDADLEGVREELRVIAADLVEIRTLLMADYLPERHVIAVGGDLHATWTWDLGHRAGLVTVARVPDDLVVQAGADRVLGAVHIGFDGRPLEVVMPWLDWGEDGLRWAVGLLRPIHRRLVGVWLDATRHLEREHLNVAEAVALACQDLASADDEGAAPDETEAIPTGRVPVVPAVRQLRLFRLLERHFECEVRRSKGSEITVWRRGTRKYTLPGHKRNTHFHANTVRALLKALGIEAADFVRAARPR